VDTYEAPTSRALSLTKLPRSEQATYAGRLRNKAHLVLFGAGV